MSRPIHFISHLSFWIINENFLNALSIKTINTIVATRITRIRKIINPEIAPVLPSSKVVTNALGISATIPEKLLKKYHFLYLFV